MKQGMTKKLKLLVAGGVLAAGMAGALVFRKAPAPPALAADPAGTLVIREKTGPHFLTEARPPKSDRPPASPPSVAMSPAEEPVVPESPPLVSLMPFNPEDVAPPAIELEYPDKFLPDGFPREADVTPRLHTIVDGDTLATLAERYLGDPGRGQELYEANRNVLSDPDLLPIGAELKIPAKTH
jgi:nucleoid-associated protein YgaU